MPPVGFEPTIPAGELPQTHALDRAATGTGKINSKFRKLCRRREIWNFNVGIPWDCIFVYALFVKTNIGIAF